MLVIDDCSTDNSVLEVEKLLPHFDGRLKILSTEKNSGGAGIPRNIGIKNASGKYITFVDNDDMILPNALEDFFKFAEEFQATVVHTVCAFYFSYDDGKNFNSADLELKKDSFKDFSMTPYLETENFLARMRNYVNGKYFWLPWGKFYRRDFLTENKIYFPQMRFAEDLTFCFKCLCLAKNYVRIPHVTNIRRKLKTSTAKMIIDSQKGIRLWLKSFLTNIIILEEFTHELKLEPNFRHNVLNFYKDKHFYMIKNLFQGLEPHEVQKIFYDELQNLELDSKGKNLIAAYFYTEKVLTR